VGARCLGAVIAVAIVVAALSLAPPPPAAGQDQEAAVASPARIGGCPAEILSFRKCAAEKAKTFDPPRTPGGRPDLQGYWGAALTSDFSVEGVSDTEPRTRDAIMPWEVGPAMIVDPPDRQIPYQTWAAKIGRKGVHYQEYVDPRTACGSGGVARPVPGTYQFLQASDDTHMLWLFEDQSTYRVIHTDGRPHIGKTIKLVQGDAVGRWEGTTLVVDVTNLNGSTWIDDAGNFYTDAAHLVERFTMIDPDTIHYEITFEDPMVYTRPWTMAWAFTRDKEPGLELIEEACRAGERDVPSFLKIGYKRYFGQPWRSR
jgi:hypothetical protein